MSDPFLHRPYRCCEMHYPVEGPTDSTFADRLRWRARREMYVGWCQTCGMDGTNVVHDPLDYRVNDPYHLEYPDVPFCLFTRAERLRSGS